MFPNVSHVSVGWVTYGWVAWWDVGYVNRTSTEGASPMAKRYKLVINGEVQAYGDSAEELMDLGSEILGSWDTTDAYEAEATVIRA